MQEYLGCEDELTFKAATGLGGGVGRMGDVCGALTGGVLAVGLQHGRATQEDEKSGPETYALVEQLYGLFEKEIGSATCYDIIRTDLRNDEERRRWVDQGGPQRCRELMKQTARLVKQVIEKN